MSIGPAQESHMTTIKIVLRWFAAVAAAILIYVLGWSAVALVWAKFGGNAVNAYELSNLLSTVAAITVGSCIVPRSQWKFVFVVLAALALFMPIWLFASAALSGTLKFLNIIDIGFTLLGLFIAYQALRVGMAGRKIRRVP
jgi:hypothetical protein